MALTLGTQFEVDANGGINRFAGLTSSSGIALYSSVASGIEARYLTNAEGIITGGAVLTIDANNADTISICTLSTTAALITYAYGATHITRILTVSGTTLTANATKSLTDTGVSYGACILIDTNKVIYLYSDSADVGQARILTISGTTISNEGSAFSYSATPVSHNAVDFFNSTEAVIVYGRSTTSYGQILDISGTTITGNTEEAMSGMGTSGAGDRQLDIAVQQGDISYAMVVAANEILTGRYSWLQDLGTGLLDSRGSAGFLNGGGQDAFSVSITNFVGTSNFIVLADPPSDYIYIAIYNWFTGSFDAQDTSITIPAGTDSLDVKLLPGTSTGIAVWNASTEALALSSIFSGYDLVVGGGLP